VHEHLDATSCRRWYADKNLSSTMTQKLQLMTKKQQTNILISKLSDSSNWTAVFDYVI
jgi:hypothetical protein